MTEEVIEDYHCQNCMHKTDVREIEAPTGDTFWVCEKCEDLIREGTARAVAHTRLMDND